MNMQITEVTIHPSNEGLLRAYVNIVFANCFMIREIRVIRGPPGLFVSMPAKKQIDGTYRQIAYPANAETPNMGVLFNRWVKVIRQRPYFPFRYRTFSPQRLSPRDWAR
jgi:stage V sporulation protein G